MSVQENITRRGALKAAFLAAPAVLAAPLAVAAAEADTMADWLARFDALWREEYDLVTQALASAPARGLNGYQAEAEVLDMMAPIISDHEATLPAMCITTPQTARRALAWVGHDRAGEASGKAMMSAVDAYLARLAY